MDCFSWWIWLFILTQTDKKLASTDEYLRFLQIDKDIFSLQNRYKEFVAKRQTIEKSGIIKTGWFYFGNFFINL